MLATGTGKRGAAIVRFVIVGHRASSVVRAARTEVKQPRDLPRDSRGKSGPPRSRCFPSVPLFAVAEACAGERNALEDKALFLSERSAARLAHQSGGLGVASSNLAAPTRKINQINCRRLAISAIETARL
jgi:hypothetical protein